MIDSKKGQPLYAIMHFSLKSARPSFFRQIDRQIDTQIEKEVANLHFSLKTGRLLFRNSQFENAHFTLFKYAEDRQIDR